MTAQERLAPLEEDDPLAAARGAIFATIGAVAFWFALVVIGLLLAGGIF